MKFDATKINADLSRRRFRVVSMTDPSTLQTDHWRIITTLRGSTLWQYLSFDDAAFEFAAKEEAIEAMKEVEALAK